MTIKIILLWLKAVRAPFFSASLIPVLVGSALASRLDRFHPLKLILALIVVVSFQAGANLLNDYYDAEGSDRVNKNVTPFSGGSRLIQEGLMSRRSYFKGAMTIYGIGLTIILLLAVLLKNIVICELGILGIVVGLIYSATQTYGMGRGWGELAVGLAFGPLATMGSFLLQTNYIHVESFLAGIPVGFLVMGVLILNEFPDFEADRAVGKRNWIVRAGIGIRGVWIYLTVICLAYFSLITGVFIGIFPVKILVSCFTCPLAVWIFLKIKQSRRDHQEMIPALAGNINLHFLTGLLISIGLWWK